MPKVSVIMSVYKEPTEWLCQSIDSILQQTYTDFEFIIICDNPYNKDGLCLLTEYTLKDRRIILIVNDKNIGLTKSLNKGLAVAKGEYIARMDADDVSLSNRLRTEVEFLDNNEEIDVCHANFSYINDSGMYIKRNVAQYKKVTQDHLFNCNIVGHPTVMFRKRLLKLRDPFYNEYYKSGQDYELWTFLSLNHCRIEFIDKVLLNYRINNNQITFVKSNEQRENLYKTRRDFIINYLASINIWMLSSENDPKAMLDSVNLHYNTMTSLTKTNLNRIKYILYYSLSSKNVLYVLRYLFDMSMYKDYWTWKDRAKVMLSSFTRNKNYLL